MKEKIIIPRQGQTMTEATIQRWLKKDGDTVTEGEDILEIFTDKVTVIVASPKTGILRITAKEEEIIPVYEEVGYVEDKG